MNNMKRRLLSCGLAAAMVLSCSVTGYAAEVDSYVDMPDDYSTDALIAAIDNGLLLGDSNQINPDANLTRGEFAAIMVRAFGATVEADISAYADVSETAWYAEYLAKAVAMGILEGDGTNLSPNDPITRQEVCTVLARIFALSSDNSITGFSDVDAVASWAYSSISAMIEGSYLLGADGAIMPGESISRKDFAVLMDRLVYTYVSDASDLTGDVIEGNIIITSADISLEGVTVTGSIIIADGVDAGVIDLSGVTVEGDIVIRSSGTVTITDTTAANIIVASNTEDTEVIVAGTSEIGEVIAEGTGATVTVDETATVEDVVSTGDGTTLNGEEVETTVVEDSTTTDTEDADTDADDSTTTTTNKTTYYTITFDYNYEGDTDTTTSVKKNGTVTMPSATRADYVLMGWSTTAAGGVECDVGDTATVTSAKTYYAVWATAATELSHLTAGGNIYISSDMTINSDTIISEDTTLYIADTATLTIVYGGTLTVNEDKTLTVYGNLTNDTSGVLNIRGDIVFMEGTYTANGGITKVYNEADLAVALGATMSGAHTVELEANISVSGEYTIESNTTVWLQGSTLTATGEGSITNNGFIRVTTEAELVNALNIGGDVNVGGSFALDNSYSVPDGTTLTVAHSSTLTISADKPLTVASGGAVEVYSSGTLSIDGTLSNDGTVTNSGTIDLRTGGTITGEGTITNSDSIYIYDFDGLQTALTIGGKVTVRANFATTDALEVATGTTLTVEGGNILTVGSGKTLTVNGTLEIGGYFAGDLKGTDETSTLVIDSGATVNDYTDNGLIAGNTYVWNGTSWTAVTVVTTSAELKAALENSATIIYVANDITTEANLAVNADTTLIVASGETLTIGAEKTMTISADKTLTVDGTLQGTDTSSKLVIDSEANVSGVTGVSAGKSYVWYDDAWLVVATTQNGNMEITTNGTLNHNGPGAYVVPTQYTLTGTDTTSKLVVGSGAIVIFKSTGTVLTPGTYIWTNSTWAYVVTTDAELAAAPTTSGTVVYINGDVTTGSHATIYSNVTWIVSSGKTLTVFNYLTLDSSSKLIVETEDYLKGKDTNSRIYNYDGTVTGVTGISGSGDYSWSGTSWETSAIAPVVPLE